MPNIKGMSLRAKRSNLLSLIAIIYVVFSTNPSFAYKYGGVKWPDTDIPVGYYVNENTNDTTGEGLACQAASQTWSSVPASSFAFQYIGSTTRLAPSLDGYNVLSWGSTGGSIATTYVWYMGSTIIECDMEFEDGYNWGTTGAFNLMDVQNIATHEFGHFLTARYYLVDASLPYFIPAPTLIGTLGAFIRIRSPILSKRALFDIGIAGPLAGFVALLSPLIAGVALSKVVPGIGHSGDLVFGTPLAVRMIEWIRFPGVPVTDIYLHPVARAAWVGLLATALNLLPIGQLDGGHIVYAFLGARTKYLSRLFLLILVLMGIFATYSWLVWAALLFFFNMRHPAIVDPNPLGGFRVRLAVTALALFILSFTVTPVHTVP